MPLLDDNTRSEVKKILERVEAPVRLVSFTQEFECDSCETARSLVAEVASISAKLRHEVYDFVKDADKAREFGVDKVPATIVVGPSGNRVRFYGVPAGYEFANLVEDVLLVSSDDSGLAESSREKLRAIDKPVHLQVLVTPT